MGQKSNKHSNVRVRLGMQGWTSGISITLVLLLVGLILLSYTSARNLSRYVKENISFTVYADPDSDDSEMRKLLGELQKQPYTKEAIYISAEEALIEQTKELDADPTEFLGYNPYTPMLEVRLKAEYANTDSIGKIEKTLKQRVQIAEIDYQDGLINSVNRNIRFIAFILSALALLFCVISYALISNTMRMAVHNVRLEVNTMQLVGASWGFIRYPFVLRCIGMGLLAATVACILLGGGYYWLVSYEPSLQAIVTIEALAISIGGVVLAGVVLTGVAALLSINHYLRLNRDKLLGI